MSARYFVGVDEVGRGPLAGPVCVCAVSIRGKLSGKFFSEIRNSKALTENARNEWYRRARSARAAGKLDYAVSFSGARFIDTYGISRALRVSIARALRRLKLDPGDTRVLLDGSIYAPPRFNDQKTITRGDEKVPLIALASIIAKVRRDARMRRYAVKFPGYGFEEHVGYGTREHYRSIKKLGICDLHRTSFLRGVAKSR